MAGNRRYWWPYWCHLSDFHHYPSWVKNDSACVYNFFLKEKKKTNDEPLLFYSIRGVWLLGLIYSLSTHLISPLVVQFTRTTLSKMFYRMSCFQVYVVFVCMWFWKARYSYRTWRHFWLKLYSRHISIFLCVMRYRAGNEWIYSIEARLTFLLILPYLSSLSYLSLSTHNSQVKWVNNP